MMADDYLRLARQARRDGRGRLREAMLTLAVGASEPGDAWADRCRARLIADRPDHFLAAHPTAAHALADPRVDRALGRLRAQFPPTRIKWLRLRADAASGPFTGEPEPLATVIDELFGPPIKAEPPVAALAAWTSGGSSDEHVTVMGESDPEPLYLALMLSIAMLLASVRSGRDRRAA